MKLFLSVLFLLSFGTVGSVSAKVTCSRMSSCAEAYRYLKKGYTKLDRDHDGIPCEKLCKDKKKHKKRRRR